MDIEQISAELRPRRPWEAIDLGISLCRRHLGKVLLLWSLSVLPIIALFSVLLWPNYLLLCILIWWLKPLFDRIPLFYLSRALFGSAPTLREFFRALPRLLTRQAFNALVMGRFSLTRSSVMPIKELEGLTGNSYLQRRYALMQSGGGQALWFLAICLFLWFFFTIRPRPLRLRTIQFVEDLKGCWAGGPKRRPRSRHRGKRHWQGTGRSRYSRVQPPQKKRNGGHQLWCDTREPPRK